MWVAAGELIAAGGAAEAAQILGIGRSTMFRRINAALPSRPRRGRYVPRSE